MCRFPPLKQLKQSNFIIEFRAYLHVDDSESTLLDDDSSECD